MDTRSKNINTFKGVLSWLSMLLLLCGATMALFLLVVLLMNPEGVEQLANGLVDIAHYFLYPSEFRRVTLFFVLYCLVGLTLLLTLVLLTFGFRKDRRGLEAIIAGWLGRIWVEIKLAGLALTALLFFALMDEVFPHAYLVEMALILCIPILTLYFLCLDISHSKRFFSHNILHSILMWLNSYREQPAFSRRSLRRLYSCAGSIAVLLLVGVIFLIGMNDAIFVYPLFSLAFLVALAVSAVGTLLWYVVSLKQDLRDASALMEQIEQMYGGNMDAVNHVPPTSNLYVSAMELNMIRIGIRKAVEEGVKADRTKVELITNVSHDIKTPLTSIISYIELLKKEPDLPDHVKDYVKTISQKADRLSVIVQDVFEVSKAATGKLPLDLEDLDIGKLLRQTFAEMDETVESSGLTWRVEIPDEPILVYADGQRLYRVFQNLIRNCTQYSLEGSRVYVRLTAQNGVAAVSIRNVSKTEIAMNGDDLTARFVRGDENRSTEGSGLGLSIAKSFTEACGGSFAVQTDGDLFTVTVQFPQVFRQPQAPAPALVLKGEEEPSPQPVPELVIEETLPPPPPESE